jgi:NADPH:quinone reductase-like Zn-dependent oxidoreductase
VRAAFIERFDPDDPASVVTVGDRPEPEVPGGWTVVDVKAASLNHHDVWTARGLGVIGAQQLPMILGSDAAGLDQDGSEVVVHTVMTDPDWLGPELVAPSVRLLSDGPQGTFAERVAVPRRNLLPKPPQLTFEEAACLPTAWLTAYRMLFTQAAVRPGATVFVQGASGGLSTALIMLGQAAGVRMWVSGRDEEKRAYALERGADAAFEPGGRLPERVDAVMDSVGAATWEHSLKVLRKGGTMVVAGVTGGTHGTTDAVRLFTNGLHIVGTVMGTLDELRDLIGFCVTADLHPPVSEVLALEEAPRAFETMSSGAVRGKVVLSP